jgi:mono/diheme cytochrome c family protein
VNLDSDSRNNSPTIKMKQSRSLLLLCVILSFGLLLSACSFSLAGDVTPPPGYQPQPVAQATVASTAGPLYPLVPPDPLKGEAIYIEKCEPCHGTNGLGNGPQAINLPNPVIAIGTSEVARQATPAKWFRVVTQGNLQRFMPPFQSLTERQRWDVVAFVFSLSAPRQSILQGSQVFQAECASCHGERGQGDGPNAGGFTMPDFTDQEFMAGKSGVDFYQSISEGAPPNMPAFGDQLTEADRWALADYLRSLSFAPAMAETQNIATPLVSEQDSSGQEGEPQATPPTSDTLGLGSVSGVVMDDSGAAIPEGLEVFLHGFDQMQIVLTATTTLQEDGSYRFPDIEMSEGRAFLVTLQFDGVTYGSDVAVVEAGQNELSLPVQVYATTTDTTNLFVDRLHYFFEILDDNTLRVVELFIISNPGNETIIASGEGQPVIDFPLPDGAANLEVQDGVLGGRYIITQDGLGDTLPIRPGMGEYQILYSYELPYNGRLDLTRPIKYLTNAVVILVPEDGVAIKGAGIEDAGTRDVQGTQYHMYSAGVQPAGSELALNISGRATSQGLRLAGGSSTNLIIGLASLGVVLLAAGVWMFRRSRPAEEGMAGDARAFTTSRMEDADTIMDAILALDDLYQEGELPESAYLQRRAELKDRLKATVGKGDSR